MEHAGASDQAQSSKEKRSQSESACSSKGKSRLPLEARHWAITLWTDTITRENFLLKMKKRKEVICILISQEHLGGKHSKCGERKHYRVYIKLSLSRPKEIFGKDICLRHWVRPIESRGGNTHAEAVQNYVKYIKAKGPNWIIWGAVPEETTTSLQSRDKNVLRKMEEIRELILSGARRTSLIAQFPSMVQVIGKLMELRPPRMHETDCLYIYGQTGHGKTTAVLQTLNTMQRLYPKLCYYSKSGGLTKYFDGYDNQPIVWMDDPCPIETRTQEMATIFKNVVGSSGPCQVEIKFGAMQFDSHLIIITSNVPPDNMAESFRSYSNEAMYRRFTQPLDPIYALNREVCVKMKKFLVQVIAAKANVYDINVDVNYVVSQFPVVRKTVYPAFKM